MKICLLDVHKPGDNKDYNGGFGTTFEVGNSLLAKLLSNFRAKNECFPLMSYGYISALLKNSGHHVFLAQNQIPEDADIVIFHTSLITHNEEIQYMKEIKEKTKAKVCTIGPLSTVLPNLFAPIADTVIVGEAENLLKNLKTTADLPTGIVHADIVKNIEELPFPDWTIYDYKRFSLYPILKHKPIAFIQGSRSCPYICNYCPYVVIKKSYRLRNHKNVVDEVAHLIKMYGSKALLFRDPCFTLNKNWVIRLCSEIKKQKIDIEWGCETRSDKLDKELLDIMYDAGLRVVEIGIESSNHTFLKSLKRIPTQVQYQEEIINYAEKRGIKILAFYILGLPNDTPETIEETIKYARKLNTSMANFTICTPIPGTEFYEEIKDKIIDHNLNHYDNFHPVFKLGYLSPEQLKKYQEKAITSYYFRIRYISKFLRNILLQK